ncbi:MAG: YceI family protein [Chitinophagaceae bacterium]|nr:YceI family protein [Chitinophagaceae bacterium]
MQPLSNKEMKLKKCFFTVLCLSSSIMMLSAQPVFSTKTARVRFFSSTPAEDIEAVNTQALSKFDSKSGQVNFMLLIKGFVFENELMQKHFNEEYLESAKFPKSEFKGQILNIASINLLKNGSYPTTAEGTITIHGVSQKIKATGTITVANGKLSLKSVFKLKIKDFNIAGSDIGKSIASELEITVDSRYD